MPNDYLSLSQILKSGIKPTDVTLTGQLTPKQGRTFANNIVATDGLLKKITVDITNKLTKQRSGVSARKGSLTRHVSGADSTDGKDNSVFGCALDMTRGVELFAQINDDTIIDNKDNPEFEKVQEKAFSTTFQNDLVFLGMVGKADNGAKTAPFDELAKGWIHNAKNDTKTTKVTQNAKDKSVIGALMAMINQFPTNIRHRASILISATDYDIYQMELADRFKSLATLLKANESSFMGYSLEVEVDMPVGTLMATPLKNMVLGLATQVKRDRWYDNLSSSLRYKFVVYPNYEFDDYELVVLLDGAIFKMPEPISKEPSLTLTATTKTVKVGSTAQVTAKADDLTKVTVASTDVSKATVAYNNTTGVAAGTADIVVTDGTTGLSIAVTVTA